MQYQLNVGKIYKFKFKSIIESINGIYKLMNIMTLDDIIDTNIDIYKTTFKVNNVSEQDYIDDVGNLLQDSIIFKLQDVYNINVIYYIPEFILSCQPIVNISSYLRLGLAVNLGIFSDINLLENIKNEIEDILRSKVGIDNNAIIFSTEEKWLTNEEYQQIEDNRLSNINNTNSIYKDNIALQKQVVKLQNIITTYEDIIKNT